MALQFNCFVSRIDAAGRLHQFVPGDDVPDWLKDHVDESVTGGPVEEPAAEDSDTKEPEAEKPVEDPAEEPDFTKPAPRRRNTKSSK